MDTAPLPPVQHGPDFPPGPDDPTDRLPAVPGDPAPAGGEAVSGGGLEPGPLLRTVEVVAGLLSGGLLILGLALLALQLLAPELAPGTGLATPSGPGWWRVAAQLGVAIAGELVVLARRRASRRWRYLLASMVIVAVLAVLWFAWWA